MSADAPCLVCDGLCCGEMPRLNAERDRLRAALLKSVEVIQTWHNMGMHGKLASDMWDIYWRNAPEMRPIREALSDESGSPHNQESKP